VTGSPRQINQNRDIAFMTLIVQWWTLQWHFYQFQLQSHERAAGFSRSAVPQEAITV
jgi:hypothetical protein